MTARRRQVAGAVAVVVALAAVGGWLGWCHAVVQTPRVDRPARVDAVVVLGGLPGAARTERGLQLVHAGLARTLVLSLPLGTRDPRAVDLCDDRPAGLDLVCFRPVPQTTQGEAQEIGRLAAAHGWTRIAVVTSTYHVARAREIVDRCTPGRTVLVLTSGERIGPVTWAWQYGYQTLGWLKVWTRSGC